MRPALLVEVHQHLLLEFALPVADGNRVIVTVEAVDECLYRWLVEVSDHGRGLRDRGEKSERSMAVGPTRQIYICRDEKKSTSATYLPRLLAEHDHLRIDAPKGINDNLALD